MASAWQFAGTEGSVMRKPPKAWILGVVVLFALVLGGCGGGGDRTFTATILSDQGSDGYIAFDPVAISYTVTNGPNTLLFGIDEGNPNFPEYRAFLDFPLDGSTGEDVVPLNATIVSASLVVRVVSVDFATTVPALLELVEYPVGGALRVADYDSAPLTFPGGGDAFLQFDLFSSDEGFDVVIPVTALMQEVQGRGLSDFQVRLLLDFVPGASGWVGIDDRPTVAVTAPTLIVQYR